MSHKISPGNLGEIALNETDTVASVVQNIAIILSTRRGSVPLYRDFGLTMDFVDRPILAAKPLIVAEIENALREYEPRATLLNVTFETDENAPGKLIPTVEVEINDEQEF
jgi:phage baseplate assembly protein W